MRRRGDTPSRALARIIAVADVIEDEVHPALVETFNMARQALRYRDGTYDARVLVVGRDTPSAAVWVAGHERPDGARCEVVAGPADIAHVPAPVTVVVLAGARDRDDWPQLAAEIAVLGDAVDVITEDERRG